MGRINSIEMHQSCWPWQSFQPVFNRVEMAKKRKGKNVLIESWELGSCCWMFSFSLEFRMKTMTFFSAPMRLYLFSIADE